MKKLLVSIALFAFITAMAAPTIIAATPKASMQQQDKKVADTKSDKKNDKACTKDKGSCCKDKNKSTDQTDKK